VKVKDVLGMRESRVVATTPEKSVQNVVDLLTKEEVGAVMVRNWEGVIIGIFSERDVVHGLSADRERLLSMEVGEVMTAGVESCGPEDDINDVITMMAKRHFRHVPVIEDSKIKGIISLRDLIEYRILKIAE
jgi:CBS domain-containing protein